MTTRDRMAMAAKHAKINEVACPKCGAPALALCRLPSGQPLIVPHQARRHAAANAGVYTPGGTP